MRFTKPYSWAPLAALSLLGASLSGGCVENKSTLYIHQIMAFDPSGGDCTIEFRPDEPFVTTGYLDLAFSDSYLAGVLIGNQLRPLGDNDTLRAETSRISLKGVEIHVYTGNRERELAAYTTTVSGTISPEDSEDPGFSGVIVQIIPPGLPLEPNSIYISSLRVFGETLGGTELESGEFEFPVQTVAYGDFADGLYVDQNGNRTCTPPTDPPAFCTRGQSMMSCGACLVRDCVPPS